MAITLKEKYGEYLKKATVVSTAAAKIDATNVYEEANPKARGFMNPLLEDNLSPDSTLANEENFKEFYDAVVKEKKRGLILMEHYSNLDLPSLCYLLEKSGTDWGVDFSNRIVAIAGMKLNEENPFVRAFAEAFTRIVIYPTRSITKMKNSTISEEEKEEEKMRAREINFSAMRAMDACKKRGQIILVFPSGTRYRPGKPDTKRGLAEIDSYIRMFDVMLLVSINGNCLRINPECPDDMVMDIIETDKIVMAASEVIDCKKFRKNVLDALPPDFDGDTKQMTVDKIMEVLENQHNEIEKTRLP